MVDSWGFSFSMVLFQDSDPGDIVDTITGGFIADVDLVNANVDDAGNELVSKPMRVVLPKSTLSDTPKISAPNLIVNGHCSTCKCDIDVSTHGIKCWGCKNFFHAIGCGDESYCVAANSSFTNHLLPATIKTRGFEKRFGCFFFLCDHCVTTKEKLTCVTQNDRVSILEKKIDTLQNDFKAELSEMKALLLDRSTSSVPISNSPEPSTVETSLWNDTQKVEKLRHMMVIKKDSQGNSIDKAALEKACVDDGVSVVNAFEMKKSGDTAIIVQSKADAETLKVNLTNTLPQHKVEQVSARTPTINVVGLSREYNKEELFEMIKRQNSGIKSVFESDASADDKKFDIVAIVPLKSRPSCFKAIIRVSNLVRSILSKQCDRIYVGSQPVCKVYDSFYILRCFKCQQFGHHSRDCKNDSKCGHCSDHHETRSCTVKANPLSASCANCIEAKNPDSKHPANDLKCPQLIGYQEKLRKSIPFYQRT